MADKILKSLTFPGSEDVYVIESGVGRDTEYGGEIFNDYENNQATGLYSHAEGEYTIAKGKAQHVAGKYNLEDTEIDDAGYGKYAYIIGGGTATQASKRKNIHTIDWDGNAWYAGSVTATKLILGPESYGTSLPEAGVEGQIFFLLGGSSGTATDDGNGIITLS